MAQIEKLGLYINGKEVAPKSGKQLDSIDPHTGEVVYQIADANEADVNAAVEAAKTAQQEWADMSPFERGKILIKVGQALRENIPTLAPYLTKEMGAPPMMAHFGLEGAAKYWEYYGGLAPSLHGETIPVGPEKLSYTIHEPFGVIGIITPWNGPLNQASRGITPALAVGNTVVLKPSEYTSASAVKFMQIAEAAGLPKGVLNVLTGGGATGAALVNHKDVGKISFTGSVPTGQKIFRAAADKIMPVSLELGGKSPDIIFEDADLAAAIPGALFGFVANSGQVCSAGTRILVQKSIYDKVCQMLIGAVKQMPIGIDKKFPCLGPIANSMQYEKVLNYLDIAKKEGTELLVGGKKATGEGLDKGMYIEPTLFGNVSPDMTLHNEEIFGPVGVIVPFEDEAEAIKIANNTEYGLVAGIWTKDISRAHRVAAKIDAGQIWINYYIEGGVEHPFGGYKKSGLGREKGMQALKEYTRLKCIVTKLA